MAGFKHNDRGKPSVWTGAGAANLQMNQSDMKEAVKTAILQHDHVLLNLTSIILSMANNHDSFTSFSARCLAAEMLSVEVKTKGEDGNVTRDTHHVNLEQAYRTWTFAREILFFMAEEVRSGIRQDFMKSKFFGHALDEATAKTKNQHVIQYISYWRRGRVLRKFWGIVPITAQDAKTIYKADKDSLLYLTDGDEVVLHKGHMGMGGDAPTAHRCMRRRRWRNFFLMPLRDSRLSRRGYRPTPTLNDPSVRLRPRPNPLFCLSFRVWRM
jgi:hypothetical protein